jgi:yecA family protein
MLNEKDSNILKELLNLGQQPVDTLSFEELLGYLFGLGITPSVIPPDEWIPIIFGGDDIMPIYKSKKQEKEMNTCLLRAYKTFTSAFQEGKLLFPFEMESLGKADLERVYQWVAGFDEALMLNEEIWDPEESTTLHVRKKQELYHSLMTVEGLVDPEEVSDYFDNLPIEIFEQTFPDMDMGFEGRDMQIQMFLLASLPLAVQTLMEHATYLAGGMKKDTATASKKNNVIKVDFAKKIK